METDCLPTVAENRKIGDWEENKENGNWHFKTEEIEIFVSFWENIEVKKAYLACLRWEYQMNNYATYVKIQQEDGDIEKLLIHAAGFVTNWLAEQKEKASKDDGSDSGSS